MEIKNKDSPLGVRQQSDYQVTTDLKAKRSYANMQKGSVFFPAWCPNDLNTPAYNSIRLATPNLMIQRLIITFTLWPICCSNTETLSRQSSSCRAQEGYTVERILNERKNENCIKPSISRSACIHSYKGSVLLP